MATKAESKTKKNGVVSVPVEGAPAPVQSVEPDISEPTPKVEGLAAPATTAPRPSQVESPKDKLLIFGNEKGGVDLESMRGKTRDKFISWVRKTPELFPVQASPGQPMAAAIPDEAISVIFNLVGIGETMLASRKFPAEIAAAAFMWTRPQINAINGPAKALIAKHAPSIRGWEEEVAFVSVLVDIHFEKLAVLRQLMAEHTAAVQAANRTPGPAPGDASARMPGDVSPADSAAGKTQ